MLRKRLKETAQTMAEVFADLHDEDGVLIHVVEEDPAPRDNSFENKILADLRM